MSGQTQTVLYELQVKSNTEAAEAGLTSLGKKASDVAGHTDLDFKVHADTSQIDLFGGKLDSLKAKATAAGASLTEGLTAKPIGPGAIEKLQQELRTLEDQKKKAFSVSEAAAFEQEIRKTKEEMNQFNKEVEHAASKGLPKAPKQEHEGGGGIASSVIGGVVGAGVATAAIEGFHFLAEKAKEAHVATEQVTVALAKAGFTGEAASEELKRIGESAGKIGDDFALPGNEVKQLMGTITGFSGLTGGALDHLTEISIGASKALGLSAEGVARLIAKSADPESVATLKRIGVTFDANATAAEKMAVIEQKLGPAIQGAKDANNDAFGSFEKVKNKLEETAVTIGSSLFEAIGPAISLIGTAFEAVEPVIKVFGTVVGGISKFMKDNSVYFGIAAAAVGAYALVTNASAIASAVATGATTVMTAAQAALNAVMNANPLALVVVAIGALVAGAVYAYKHFQAFRDVIDGVWSGIKKVAEAVWSGIKFWAEWLNPVGLLIKGFGYLYEKLDFVKKGVDTVVGAVKDAGSWLLNLVGITTKEDEATKKTNESLKLKAEAELAAADAAKKNAEAMEASLVAMENEQKGAKEGVDEARRRYLLNKQIANDPTQSEANRKLARQYLEDNIAYGKSLQDKINQTKKFSDEYDKATGVSKDKKEKEAKSEFELAMKNLDAEAKTREAATLSAEGVLREKALSAYLAGTRKSGELTKKEEANIATQRLADRKQNLEALRKLTETDEQGNVIDLKVGSKSGDEAKDLATVREKLGNLQIAVSKEQLDILKLTPKLDEAALAKLQDEISASINSRGRTEIALGLRPKEDNLSIMDDEIDRLHQNLLLASAKLSLAVLSFDPTEIAKAQVEYNNLFTALNNKTKESTDFRKGLNQELRDAEIAAMDEGQAKDTAILADKQKKELEQFNVNYQLTAREVDLKFAIEKKHQKELLDLKKKYAVEAGQFEKDLVASAQKGITSIIEATFAKRSHLSALDVADKNLGFQKEQEALTKSLNSGAISYQEYQIKSQKLAQDAADFRKSQENEVGVAVVAAAKNAVKATLEVVNAKIALTAASAFAGAVGTDPTPLGLVEGAAASALVLSLLKAMEGKLGFATGGLAFTGEKGPEVIGPVKDFSDFATQLVLTTSKQVAQSLSNQMSNEGGRRGSNQDIGLRFRPLGIPGRDLNYTIQRDNLVSKTERIGTNQVA